MISREPPNKFSSLITFWFVWWTTSKPTLSRPLGLSTQVPYFSSIILSLKSTTIYQMNPLLSLETQPTRKANSAWSGSTLNPHCCISRTSLHGTPILLMEMPFLRICLPTLIGIILKTQLLVLSFRTFPCFFRARPTSWRYQWWRDHGKAHSYGFRIQTLG